MADKGFTGSDKLQRSRGLLTLAVDRAPLKTLPKLPTFTMEDPTFPMLLTRQTVRQSFDLCSHRGQALS